MIKMDDPRNIPGMLKMKVRSLWNFDIPIERWRYTKVEELPTEKKEPKLASWIITK